MLHTNRAASYLARGAEGGDLSNRSEDLRGLLEGVDLSEPEALARHSEAALMDAESAIAMDPGFGKAYLRKAQALQRLDRLGVPGGWKRTLVSCKRYALFLQAFRVSSSR